SIAVGAGAGVVLQGAGNSLYNSGTIAASGRLAAVQLDSGSTSHVTNRGSITSAAACVSGTGAGATSVINSGVLDCGGNAVTLGAGDDNVTLADNSITRGDIDLGGGNDVLVLDVGAGLAGRLDGSLLGAEALHKNGAGMFTLAGDAEVGFTSAHVNAGTLVLVGGTLTGNTHVHAGATLQALGYAFNGDVENAGVLVSGDGVLAIAGDFAQSADGSLHLYSNVSGSDSSRIEAAGTATLGGQVHVTVTDPGSLLLGYNDIVLVEAGGGVSGAFSGFTDNLVDSIDSALVYDADQALLRVTLPPDSGAMLGFGAGTAHASGLVASVMDQRLRVLDDSRRAAAQDRAQRTHEGPWIQYYASEATFQGAGSAGAFDVAATGGLAGLDFRLGDATTLGVALGYGDSATTTTAAHGTTRSLQGGLYASHGFARGYLEGVAMYSSQEYRVQRRTLFGDIAGSTHDGEAIGLRLGGGFQLRDGIAVFDQVAYDHVDQDGYVESGATGFAQAFDADSFESLRNRLGLRLSSFRPGGDGTVASPWLELAWEHDFLIDEVQVASRPATAAGP